MNPQDPKYQEKLKSIAAPEQNYFAHFAMRYPVVQQVRNIGKEMCCVVEFLPTGHRVDIIQEVV